MRAECLAAGAAPEDVLVKKCDCSVEEEMMALKAAVYERFGKVHFLMNNAATQTVSREKFKPRSDAFTHLSKCPLFLVHLRSNHVLKRSHIVSHISRNVLCL